MAIIYSAHQAKVRFSELLRLVREGSTVTVAYRGQPAAEVRPVDSSPRSIAEPLDNSAGSTPLNCPVDSSPTSIEERLDDLTRPGALVPADQRSTPLRPTARREGALDRFLTERGV